jgi:hypothetical protein
MSTEDIESKTMPQEHEQVASEKSISDAGPLKLDPQGFPLRPQPSDDPLG